MMQNTVMCHPRAHYIFPLKEKHLNYKFGIRVVESITYHPFNLGFSQLFLSTHQNKCRNYKRNKMHGLNMLIKILF